MNLRREVERDGRLDARFELVSGWRAGEWIEKASWLPRPVRARARILSEVSAFASFPRPDVIWTSAPPLALLPFLWSQLGRWRRPLMVQLDWTREQQEEMAPAYYNRPPHPRLLTNMAIRAEGLVYGRSDVVAPWSRWAGDALIRAGVPPGRVRVLPPGVELDRWRVNAERWVRPEGSRLRLLLVGGDFVRKGGRLLLEAMNSGLAEQFELDIVTRDEVTPAPGVRVHRAEPGDPLLAELYARAHIFVMPSIAECFGIATIEAMASGLPVLVSDVGASAEIVEAGKSGWLVAPTTAGVVEGLRQAMGKLEELPAMGSRGREIAEQRFDARSNARAVIETLLEVTAPRR